MYWATYKSETLKTSLEEVPGSDEACDQLTAGWTKLQGLKDRMMRDDHISSGRNRVDLSAKFDHGED